MYHLWWRALLVSAGLFLAACATAASEQSLQPCTVVEGRRGAIDTGPVRYVLAPEQSLEYCSDSLVINHVDQAFEWYQQQLQANSYPPALIEELARYYSGPLLHQARESIYADQRAGRVVVGRWSTRDLVGQSWAPDGTSITLTFAVPDYKLFIYKADRNEPEIHQGGGDFERWIVRLVYDTNDQRWKIAETRTAVVR